MRWLQTEYILKGIFLGLLLFVALQDPTSHQTGRVALSTLGGFVLFLGVAAVQKVREGYQVQGRILPFILFLLLESPRLVYAGIILGMALGTYWIRQPGDQSENLLVYTVGGGVLLGVVFGFLRQVHDRRLRFGLSLLLAVVLVTGALALFGQVSDWAPAVTLTNPVNFGIHLLLGIPLFYLLTFAGREEESEVEIGVICATLGLGIYLLKLIPSLQSLGFVIPLAFYYVYTTRIMPGLRVFKHTLRGLSYARIGRHRLALMSLKRALQLDPQNKLARETLWSVHRAMDLPQLMKDSETLALVDLDLCLERAASLLLEPGPTPQKLEEADRLLDLILSQKPAMRPRVGYWRAVAHTHARLFDQATAELEHVLDPTQYDRDDAERRAVLLPAWQLALTLHEELRRRVGVKQLALPGRRMDAIGAVERQLAENTDDPATWNLKRLLYQDVTESEYDAAATAGQPAPDFDHSYAQQLGLALINDPARWQRGGEYLRLAARGLPAFGPTLFIQIAQANQRAGIIEGAWQNYELAKRAGRAVGPKNLSDEDRQAYFATVKMLGDAALERGDTDAALENFQLFAESERSGVETLRTLADLHERKGDPLTACRFTEQALVYNSKDKDLLERKDKYYYSVMPEVLQANLEAVRGWFDIPYCLWKAGELLKVRGADLDLIDWAEHLIRLARVTQPDGVAAKVLLARALLRRGEKDEAVTLFEDVYKNKPEKFASGADEDAWFLTCQILGKLYLEELGRPDLAVPCFQDFRKSPKSGADTMYRLGQAYEQLGDRTKAAKCYEHVTSYDSHPLAPDARDALYRLQA